MYATCRGSYMIYLCSALCTLKPKNLKNLKKPKKPKNLKKIPKNLGFFQPCSKPAAAEEEE